MRNGDGSIAEVLKPNGCSYDPKRWRTTISYTVEQTDGLGNARLDNKGKPIKKRIRMQKRTEGTKAEARELRDRSHRRTRRERSPALRDRSRAEGARGGQGGHDAQPHDYPLGRRSPNRR